MPRRNHPRAHRNGRNLAKIYRVGGGLDALADREERAQLIADWIRDNGQKVRDRWNWYRKAGTNKTPRHVLVICSECDHHIRTGEGICTVRYEEGGEPLVFHWKRGETNCWSRFLSRKVREAAEAALFNAHEEIA